MTYTETNQVVVTGGARGIGAACAEMFQAEGASVRLLDRDFTTATDSLDGLERISRHTADISDEAAIDAHFSTYGPADILVNCAGIVPSGSLVACSIEDFRTAMEVNVTGSFIVSRAAVNSSLAAERPLSIVNIASVISSLSAAPDRLAYAASKAALIGMTKSIALDFIRDGVRCNVICPGTIDTESLRNRISNRSAAFGGEEKAIKAFHNRQPIGRMGTPEEIAELVSFVASNRVEFMTGAVITADGGFSL